MTQDEINIAITLIQLHQDEKMQQRLCRPNRPPLIRRNANAALSRKSLGLANLIVRIEKRKQVEGGKASLDMQMQMQNGAKRQKSSDSWGSFEEEDELMVDARARRGYEWSTGRCTCVKE